jgi:hypothetical protein
MRVGIIGSGRRATLYIDALRALREEFEITSIRCRTQEKADLFHTRYGVPVTLSMDAFKSAKPDFVVNVVNYHEVSNVTLELLRDGIPVLSETPAAATMQGLHDLWRLSTQNSSKILVSENYYAEPYYAAIIRALERGYLGDVQTVTIASTHDYHAASLIRILLGVKNEAFTLIGKKMDLDMSVTQDYNWNLVQNGSTQLAERYHLILNFPHGKTAFYDFAIAQYWSAIRSRSLLVQGSRGEIKDKHIWYIAKNGNPVKTQFRGNRDADGGLVSISLGDDVVYENELHARGIYSNIGVCRMLLNMKRYLETGVAEYPFASAMQDAYMMQLFQECGQRPFELISSEVMPWQQV